MIKILKSNKIKVILILFICLIFATNVETYSKSCLNGVSVWAIKIFPVMFPFFVFTRIITNLSDNKPTFMDKFFNKLYNTPTGSFKTFLLSILSGYPMGAKLISSQFNDKIITRNDAIKMLSFCSVSGPMFMLGTVGVSILHSYKAGLIILISNIIACLINGIIYKGKPIKNEIYQSKNEQTNFNLSEHVSDSLNSILMVGAYIVLSFLLIEMLKNIGVINLISNTICGVFNISHCQDITKSTLCGIMEITHGIIDINNVNISLILKTIIASFLIGFGGLSVFLQSLHFLNKLKIKKRIILIQKLTQGILSLIISIPFSIWLL